MNSRHPTVYDYIFVGGGLASLFAAYATLADAQSLNKTLRVLVITQEIKAPVTAGSHWVQQIEGMMEGPAHIGNFDTIRDLLSAARHALSGAIEKEKIECRFLAGYEIKAKSKKELEDFIAGVTKGGIASADDLAVNSGHQTFRLPGYNHSATLTSIGQVNSPELLNALVGVIENMGGRVLTGVTYTGQSAGSGNQMIVETSAGPFHARHKPFLGIGALNALSLPDFDFGGKIAYTGALVVGPLSESDARRISKKPIAICDINVNDDVFWGGLDPENMLTIGQGQLDNEDDIPALAAKLSGIADSIIPDATQNYPSTLSTGPMLITQNGMPVVGRMSDYDIATGWAGLGIVPAFAAARAFAAWYVRGDDRDLRIFEAMQPAGFAAPAPHKC